MFYIDGGIGGISAQLSYYMLFTFFPVLLFGSTVLARLVPSGHSLSYGNLVPYPVMEFASSYIGEIGDTGGARVMALSVILTFYSLTRYVKKYREALRSLYGGEKSFGFILDWVLSFLFSVFLLILFFFACAAVFLTDNLLTYLGLSGAVLGIWYFLRFFAVSIYAFFIICAIYFTECASGRGLRYCMPGAATAVIVWGAISAVFSYYAGEIADYSVMYGSLGNVIMLLVWLNITNTILLMCGYINTVFSKRC